MEWLASSWNVLSQDTELGQLRCSEPPWTPMALTQDEVAPDTPCCVHWISSLPYKSCLWQLLQDFRDFPMADPCAELVQDHKEHSGLHRHWWQQCLTDVWAQLSLHKCQLCAPSGLTDSPTKSTQLSSPLDSAAQRSLGVWRTFGDFMGCGGRANECETGNE